MHVYIQPQYFALEGLLLIKNIWFSYLSRDITNALNAKARVLFYHDLAIFITYMIVAVPTQAYYSYFIGRLQINWRDWMTDDLLRRTLRNRNFYRLARSEHIDNPDQRVSEDVRQFTETTLSLSIATIGTLLNGISFAVILATISIPILLFLPVYALTGTLLCILAGRNLVSINFDQQRYEADFRFGPRKIARAS